MHSDCSRDDVQAGCWKFIKSDGDQQSEANRLSATGDRSSKRHFPVLEGANKGQILIVDDDSLVRETLADLLEIMGYCPPQAADAREALMILRREAGVDVLMTDLTMPGADGITLIRHAREFRHTTSCGFLKAVEFGCKPPWS